MKRQTPLVPCVVAQESRDSCQELSVPCTEKPSPVQILPSAVGSHGPGS